MMEIKDLARVTTCEVCGETHNQVGRQFDERPLWRSIPCACERAAEEARQRDLAERRERAYNSAWERVECEFSSMPARYRKAWLDSIPAGPARDAIEETVAALPEAKVVFESGDRGSFRPIIMRFGQYNSEAVPSFALFGPVGTGKTHSMCAMLNAIFPKLVVGHVLPVAEFIASIKATFGSSRDRDEDYESEVQLFAKYADAPILVLDDLGKVRTPYAVETLYRLIDRRYNLGLPLWVTANSTPNELAKQFGLIPDFGQALIDRVVEMTNRRWICVDGPSRRLVSQ